MTRILSPELEQYLHDHTRAQAPIFDELREVTYRDGIMLARKL